METAILWKPAPSFLFLFLWLFTMSDVNFGEAIYSVLIYMKEWSEWPRISLSLSIHGQLDRCFTL